MNETPHCHALIETISDYVDGVLDPALCAELERHLKDCDNCRIVVNTMRKTIELYKGAFADETIPEEVRQRLYFRLDLVDFLQP